MTKQEIFDVVWNGLAAQGWKQSKREGVCQYRGEGGCKCAIGHLIPDERYHVSMEPRTAAQIARFLGLDQSLDAFLYELQIIHDSDNDEEGPMPKRYRRLASLYSLTVPEAA